MNITSKCKTSPVRFNQTDPQTDKAKVAQLPPFGRETFQAELIKRRGSGCEEKTFDREENKATRTFSVQVSSSFSNRHGRTSASTQKNQELITNRKGPTTSVS